MPDLEVKFTTKYEEQGAQQALAALERQIGAAKVAGEAWEHLESKAQRMRAALSQVAEAAKEAGGESFFGGLKEKLAEVVPGFEKLEGAVTKLASGGLASVAVAIAGVGAALEAAREGIMEFAKLEGHVGSLDAALAQTGQLTDDYREKLQDLAEEMEKATTIGKEDWLDVLTRLTQFGANSQSIDEYTEAVKNLAGLMGGDIHSAAQLFARAMQGNFEAFGRYGISVEDASTHTEKLEKLMEQLANRGGGQLEARGKGLNGAFSELKNNAADVLSGFGGMIASTGVLQAALGALSFVFGGLASMMGGVVPKAEGLNNALQSTVAPAAQAEIAAKNFAAAQNEIKIKTDSVVAALDREVDKIRELQRIQDEIKDAQMALALAKIDRDEKSGKTSHSAAISLRAAARISFGAAREGQAKKSAESEIGAKQAAINTIKDNQETLQGDITSQEKLVDQLERFEKRKRDYSILFNTKKEQLDAEEKKAFDTNEPFSLDWMDIPGFAGGRGRGKSWTNIGEYDKQRKMFDQAYAALEKEKQSTMEGLETERQKTFRPGTGTLPFERDYLGKLKEAQTESVLKDAPTINKLTEEIEKLRRALEGQTTVNSLKRQTENVGAEGDKAAAKIAAEKEAEQKRQHIQQENKRIYDEAERERKAGNPNWQDVLKDIKPTASIETGEPGQTVAGMENAGTQFGQGVASASQSMVAGIEKAGQSGEQAMVAAAREISTAFDGAFAGAADAIAGLLEKAEYHESRLNALSSRVNNLRLS